MWSHIHTGESYNQPSNLSNLTASFSRLSSNFTRTHTHTQAESSQMFSISAVGLCWGTRAIRGEFYAITVEQYTQQVSVHPTVARVLLNILTACPDTARRERRSCCLFQKRLARRCVVLAVFHLLALSCMLSCTVRIRPPAPPHLLSATCSNLHPPRPPQNPLHPSPLRLREDSTVGCTVPCCAHTVRCVYYLWARFDSEPSFCAELQPAFLLIQSLYRMQRHECKTLWHTHTHLCRYTHISGYIPT